MEILEFLFVRSNKILFLSFSCPSESRQLASQRASWALYPDTWRTLGWLRILLMKTQLPLGARVLVAPGPGQNLVVVEDEG